MRVMYGLDLTLSQEVVTHPGFMFQIDVGTVPLLQDALMEVVTVMNVQIPAAHLRDAHVMSAELCRLDVPQHILAFAVLVAHLHHGCRHSVHALSATTHDIALVGRSNVKLIPTTFPSHNYKQYDQLRASSVITNTIFICRK